MKKNRGDYLNRNGIVLTWMKNNNGYITSTEAGKIDVTNKHLQRMVEAGIIDRVAQGLYMNPDEMIDEYYVAQYRCKKGVFSHETALYLHDLCDRTPLQLNLTIPSGYNTPLLTDDNYRFFYCKNEWINIGKEKLLSPYGNVIILYDMERTLCDCVRKMNKLDQDMVLFALKQYTKKDKRDYAKLLNYARVFKIYDKMKQYISLLLW